MTGEVVGVGVGNEGAGFRIPWIEPQVGFWQIQASLETDFDHVVRKLRDIAGSAKGNRGGGLRSVRGGAMEDLATEQQEWPAENRR